MGQMMWARNAALQRFTRRLTAKWRVEDALCQAASATFGHKVIIDMIVLAGCCQMGVFRC